MENTILIVDDDKEISKAIQTILTQNGYRTILAHDGLEALDIVMSQDIQLILMDIMMPKLDGLSATMKLRESNNIPVIILSAKSEDSDKVLGLSMGADDYMVKPFSKDELLARVNAALRRYLHLGSSGDVQMHSILKVGGLALDTDSKQLYVDGQQIKLTAKEYKILELLMTYPGIVFSAEKIYEKVWQEEAFAVENTVMVHIRRIREKIEVVPKDPKYLKVVWGIGYKIEKL